MTLADADELRFVRLLLVALCRFEVRCSKRLPGGEFVAFVDGDGVGEDVVLVCLVLV